MFAHVEILTPHPPMHLIFLHSSSSIDSSTVGGIIPIPQSGWGHNNPPARKTYSSAPKC